MQTNKDMCTWRAGLFFENKVYSFRGLLYFHGYGKLPVFVPAIGFKIFIQATG